MSCLPKQDQLLRLARFVVKPHGLFLGSYCVVLDGDEQRRTGRNLLDDIFGTELHDRLGALERHLVGNLRLHLFLYRGGLALGRLDHDLFPGADDLSGACQCALFPILIDALEIVQPLILPPHGAQPIPPVADTQVTDGTFHPWFDGGDVNGVPSAGASRSIGGDPVGIDLRPGLQVSDAVADIFDLPLRHDPAALLSLAITPPSVVKAQARVTSGTEFFEHHDVVFGVPQTEKTRPLNHRRPWLALLSVRKIEVAAQFVALAIERNFLTAHLRLL